MVARVLSERASRVAARVGGGYSLCLLVESLV